MVISEPLHVEQCGAAADVEKQLATEAAKVGVRMRILCVTQLASALPDAATMAPPYRV